MPAWKTSDRLLADLLSGDGTERRVEVYVLDGKRDGIEQISEVLAGYTGLDAVHIISHGSDGQVQLGSGALDAAALAANSQSVNDWGNALSLDADLLLYGCNLAASEAGQSLVTTLAGLTGADVAASDDLTGSVALGGDWDLEYQSGSIEYTVPFSQETVNNWENVLAETVIESYEPAFTAMPDQSYEVKSVQSQGQTFVHDSAAATYEVHKLEVVLYKGCGCAQPDDYGFAA